MLTYMQVHLYYTLPPTIILYFLMRPVISSFDKIKLFTLCALALVYATPWDNYVIYHKTWWYRKDAIIGTLGYVPLEEYLFFIIQTILTGLWTSGCSRWTINSLFLQNTNRLKYESTRYGGIFVMLMAMLWGWFNAIPTTKTFYLASVAWWTLLVIIILWYVSGPYVVQRYQKILISVFVPSIYLCYVDLIALRARVWHINEQTSLQIYAVDDLPLEEVIFFFAANFMIAMGSAGFDKSKAIIDTYCKESFSSGLSIHPQKQYFDYIKMLAKGAVSDEHNFDSTVIDDLKTCIVILNKASKTFRAVANCFPNAIRQDLTILYSFCRVTDDMVDNEHSVELKKQSLSIVLTFLDQLFSNRQITMEYCWKLRNNSDASIDWEYFENQLTEEQMCSFRAIARISYYMPQEPFYELVKGYTWDMDGRTVRNENDLIEYSKCVASSVATLCTFVFCQKSYQWPDSMGPKCKFMLEKARELGLVLQICNISRDIIIDSETLGRCYIPNSYLHGDDVKHLLQRNPNKILNSKLKICAEKMLDIADNIANEAYCGITLLPKDCQRPVLAALEAYRGIGKQIRSNAHYKRRATLTTFGKVLIVIKCMYVTNMESLYNRTKKKV